MEDKVLHHRRCSRCCRGRGCAGSVAMGVGVVLAVDVGVVVAIGVAGLHLGIVVGAPGQAPVLAR